MQKLLMLGTSKGSCEMVEYAKSIGVHTIVTDPRSPQESRAKLISDEYWMIDTSDVDALEKRCIEEKVTGVCCGISTFCIPVMMELCRRLNLPTYCTPESWHYTMNKYDFKALCRKNNVPVATDYFVSEQPTEEELSKIKFPVVVKAVDQSANRGMSYCNSVEDIIPAIEYAHTFSKNKNIVIERMLKGVEYTAYYALQDGEAKLVSLYSDLAQIGTPNNCYSVNSTACDKLDVYLKEVDPFFKNAIKEGDLKHGVCWIELILDEDGHFYVIEMGYRMTGDMMAIPLRDVYGFDSYKWLVEIALGVKHNLDDVPSQINQKKSKCGCAYILWSNNTKGIVKTISGVEGICLKGLAKVTPDLGEGHNYRAYQYLLTFTFLKDNVEQVCEMIDRINKEVSILNEKGEDIALRFTDFEELRRIGK